MFEPCVIVVRIIVTSFTTRIRGAQIVMNIGNYLRCLKEIPGLTLSCIASRSKF